jgi:hypothetical protein
MEHCILSPYTIRARSVTSIVGMILFGLFALYLGFVYLQGHLSEKIFLIIETGIAGLVLWIWTYRLTIEHNCVSIKSIFSRERSLSWDSISAVGISIEVQGTQGSLNTTLVSKIPEQKNIQFYYTYFSRHDLHLLLQTILAKSPGVRFDQATNELLARSKKSFEKHFSSSLTSGSNSVRPDD